MKNEKRKKKKEDRNKSKMKAFGLRCLMFSVAIFFFLFSSSCYNPFLTGIRPSVFYVRCSVFLLLFSFFIFHFSFLGMPVL